MNLRILRLFAFCLFSFVQYSYSSQFTINIIKQTYSIQRTDGVIDRKKYRTADLITEAKKDSMKTLYSKRNSKDIWATTYMHILMYQLLLLTGALDNPEKMITIITDTLNDGTTSAIEHSTQKHIIQKTDETGQPILEYCDSSGYKTVLNITSLLEYFNKAEETVTIDEDKKFAEWLYYILGKESLEKRLKTPIELFTFLDALGYIFSDKVKYRTEKEKGGYYATSLIYTLSINETVENLKRPIKMKAIFHSKEPLSDTPIIIFKTLYPITGNNYDEDQDYIIMDRLRPQWLLRAQALEKSVSTWSIAQWEIDQLVRRIRDEAEKNIQKTIDDAKLAKGYQLQNYISYFATLYHVPDKAHKEYFPDQDHILDLLLKDGDLDATQTVMKNMVQRIPYLITILIRTVFNSHKEIESVHLFQRDTSLEKELQICKGAKTIAIGKGIAEEANIVSLIGNELLAMCDISLETPERKKRIKDLKSTFEQQISDVQKIGFTKFPKEYFFEKDETKELINVGLIIQDKEKRPLLIVDDSPERSFCFSIYCLNKAILDFQDKYSLDTSVQLYDSTDLLKHLIGGMQYVSSDKQSYKTIESFSYQFTKQFIWMYYMRSTITEKDQINNEIKRLRDTAAENPLALSLTNVMQAILQKNTKELQDTVRTAKEKIQKIAHDYLMHSFRQAINRKRHK